MSSKNSLSPTGDGGRAPEWSDRHRGLLIMQACSNNTHLAWRNENGLVSRVYGGEDPQCKPQATVGIQAQGHHSGRVQFTRNL
ncbi:hypothetical protein E2C01_008500 [Portunus trituberculatus]|uniref:Uncharacterized protein n=1 Tax=Portunus trituberculatus TaxID=210409 RepID=A0A5B7D0Y5_PORTR|nr:hypothetical protein [Portunus trituberculatus]